ncbi:MAG: hypothetical protein J2O49_08645 [Sciscionella sp.]|nr:hypothetical protein [Sciscionella sp.]
MRTTKLAIAMGFLALIVAGCDKTQSGSGATNSTLPGPSSSTASAATSAPAAPGSATGAPTKGAPGTTTVTTGPIEPGGGGTAGGSAGAGGSVTAVPDGGPQVPASQIDASGLSEGRAGKVWTQDNGTVLATEAEQSGCEQVSGQVGEQTSTKVVFVIVIDEKKAKGKMCPMIVRNVPVAVRLNAPLGKRTVVLQSKKVNN